MNTDKLKEALPFIIGAMVKNKENGKLYIVSGYTVEEDYTLCVRATYLKDPNDEYEYLAEYFELVENVGEIYNNNEMVQDIKELIGCWFSALEAKGCEPWEDEKCISMARKYGYTTEDYWW